MRAYRSPTMADEEAEDRRASTKDVRRREKVYFEGASVVGAPADRASDRLIPRPEAENHPAWTVPDIPILKQGETEYATLP
jgi:hypothetical protein